MKQLMALWLAACLLTACGGETNPQAELPAEDTATPGVFDFDSHTVLLNSGYEMPIMGLGTYSLSDEECYRSVTALLEAGGRLVDTAYMYPVSYTHPVSWRLFLC